MLTFGECCAEWFTFRQFRVTGTNTGMFLLSSLVTSTILGIVNPEHTRENTCAELFQVFHGSWFGNKVSTETMMRGSVNEELV